jgi:hypothetical protein
VADKNLLKLTFFKNVLNLVRLLKSCAVAGRLFHGSTNTLDEEKLARVNSTLLAEQLKAMATRIMSRIDV